MGDDGGTKEQRFRESFFVSDSDSLGQYLEAVGLKCQEPDLLLNTVKSVMGTPEGEPVMFKRSFNLIFDSSPTPNDRRFFIDFDYSRQLAAEGFEFLPPPRLLVEGEEVAGVRVDFKETLGSVLVERRMSLVTSSTAVADGRWSAPRDVGKFIASYSTRVIDPSPNGLKTIVSDALSK